MRFGSAEIYDVVERCFAPGSGAADGTHAAHAVADCLAVGQALAGADERVVLFVKLPAGQTLAPELAARIRAEVRARRSARHVPAKASALESRVARACPL